MENFGKTEPADPRPPGTFFHTAPHRLHFLMQHSRPRFSPGGAVQIVAYRYHRPIPEKGPLPQIAPAPTERTHNIDMNNIVSFKSELVSKVIDAIFNTDLNYSEITQLSNVSKEFDFFGAIEKTAEKVVGDFIIKNFRFLKEGRIIYTPEGLATKVINLLWNKYA